MEIKSMRALRRLALPAVLLAASGCVKLPEYTRVEALPKTAETAEIRLAGDGPLGKHMGIDLGNKACLVFDEKFAAYIDSDWTRGRGIGIIRRYRFTDQARFRVPAGTYSLKLLCRTTDGNVGNLAAAFDEPVTFEAGQRYVIGLMAEEANTPAGKAIGISSVKRLKKTAADKKVDKPDDKKDDGKDGDDKRGEE